MKVLLMTILVVILGGVFSMGQDAENKTGEPLKDGKNLLDDVKATPPLETLSSLKQSGLSYDRGTLSDVILPELTIETNIPLQTIPTNKLTTIELERVEIHGTLTPAIKKRTFGSVLQLFNPFAPEEYGGNATPAGRDSFDPTTDGPATVLIGVGFKQKPADTGK